MFDPERLSGGTKAEASVGESTEAQAAPSPGAENRVEPPVGGEGSASGNAESQAKAAQLILTEQQALKELPALPIYFASSYALVKPYVAGFDANLLDAPSLQHVRIETNWQPPTRDTPIRIVSNR